MSLPRGSLLAYSPEIFKADYMVTTIFDILEENYEKLVGNFCKWDMDVNRFIWEKPEVLHRPLFLFLKNKHPQLRWYYCLAWVFLLPLFIEPTTASKMVHAVDVFVTLLPETSLKVLSVCWAAHCVWGLYPPYWFSFLGNAELTPWARPIQFKSSMLLLVMPIKHCFPNAKYQSPDFSKQKHSQVYDNDTPLLSHWT